MNFVKVVNSKLNVEEISNLVSSPSCGAISVFIGTARDNFEDKEVRILLSPTVTKDYGHEVIFAIDPNKLGES
jgi:molybdopterin synthase catalytic subunit